MAHLYTGASPVHGSRYSSSNYITLSNNMPTTLASHEPTTPVPTPVAPPKKKRKSRAGVRTVATLSPEALKRKQENDRRAQRVVRNRTKEHIKNLERQVAESKGHRDLIESLRQENATLQAEMRRLRDRLRMSHTPTGAGDSPFRAEDPVLSSAIPGHPHPPPPPHHHLSLAELSAGMSTPNFHTCRPILS